MFYTEWEQIEIMDLWGCSSGNRDAVLNLYQLFKILLSLDGWERKERERERRLRGREMWHEEGEGRETGEEKEREGVGLVTIKGASFKSS